VKAFTLALMAFAIAVALCLAFVADSLARGAAIRAAAKHTTARGRVVCSVDGLAFVASAPPLLMVRVAEVDSVCAPLRAKGKPRQWRT
jgi:hypothetical protein